MLSDRVPIAERHDALGRRQAALLRATDSSAPVASLPPSRWLVEGVHAHRAARHRWASSQRKNVAPQILGPRQCQAGDGEPGAAERGQRLRGRRRSRRILPRVTRTKIESGPLFPPRAERLQIDGGRCPCPPCGGFGDQLLDPGAERSTPGPRSRVILSRPRATMVPRNAPSTSPAISPEAGADDASAMVAPGLDQGRESMPSNAAGTSPKYESAE